MYMIDSIFYHAYKVNERYKHENALMFGFYAIVFLVGMNIFTIRLIIGTISRRLIIPEQPYHMDFIVVFVSLLILSYLSVIRGKRYSRIIERFDKRNKKKGSFDKITFIGYSFSSFVLFVITLLSVSK